MFKNSISFLKIQYPAKRFSLHYNYHTSLQVLQQTLCTIVTHSPSVPPWKKPSVVQSIWFLDELNAKAHMKLSKGPLSHEKNIEPKNTRLV